MNQSTKNTNEPPSELKIPLTYLFEISNGSEKTNTIDLYEILKSHIKDPQYENEKIVINIPVTIENNIENIFKGFPNHFIDERSIVIRNIIFQSSFTINVQYDSWKKLKIKDLDIRDAIFKTTFSIQGDFDKCLFNNTIFSHIHIAKKCTVKHTIIIGCHFYANIQYEGRILKNISMTLCHFYEYVSLVIPVWRINENNNAKMNKQNHLQKIQFTHCKFKKSINFSNLLLKQVTFFETVFYDTATFLNCFLYGCEFTLTTFSKKVSFEMSKFISNNEFNQVQFSTEVDFSGTIFKKNPLFNQLILNNDSHMYFGNLNHNSLAIDIFTIHHTIIRGTVIFNSCNIKYLDMQGCSIIGTLSRVKFNPLCMNWETACLLKNEELKNNNIFNALEYQAIEKDKYLIELWNNKELGNYLILLISKLVNNHGRDWMLAIGFTLWIWFFSYTIFITPNNLFWRVFSCLFVSFVIFGIILKATLNHQNQYLWKIVSGIFYCLTIGILISHNSLNFTDYFNGLVTYFIPTNYDQLINPNFGYLVGNMDYIKFFGIVLYILGKILIIFGGYEIVKAFRKYK